MRMRLTLLVIFLVSFISFGSNEVFSTTTVISGNGFFDIYNQQINGGTCPFTAQRTGNFGDLDLLGAPVTIAAGGWPSTNVQCSNIPATGMQSSDGWSWTNIGYHDNTRKSGVTLVIQKTGILPRAMEIITSSTLSTKFNNFQTTSIPGGRTGFPIMHFGWCGERIRVIYDKTTLSPSEVIVFEEDGTCDPNDVRNIYQKVRGTTSGLNSQRVFFGSGAESASRPYTFPLPVECNQYGVQTSYSSHSDWRLITTMQTVNSGPLTTITESGGGNRMTIRLTENNKKLSSIEIDNYDGSNNIGGNYFTIYCINPVPPPDADLNKSICVSPWAWSDVVNATPAANRNTGPCCGDDSNDVGKVAANLQCVRNTNGNYAWIPYTVSCYAGVCCGAGNVSRIVADSSDISVCVQEGSTYRWANASTESRAYNFTSGTTIASNGTQWIVCGNMNQTVAATITRTNTAPQEVTSGEFEKSKVCSVITNLNQNPGGGGPSYICAGNWTTYNANNRYLFTEKTPATTPKQFVTPPATNVQPVYVCQNGALAQTTVKWSPDKRTSSNACAPNECYYNGGPSALAMNDKCVPDGEWVLDSYCKTGDWTTRTRLLAEDLVSTSPFQGNYILHCDIAPESINNPTTPNLFTSGTPPLINSFCVIQTVRGTNTPQVMVGVTLNTFSGVSDGLSSVTAGTTQPRGITITRAIQSAQRTFASTINHSRVDIGPNNCQSADTWSPSDQYGDCSPSAGTVMFNTEIEGLVFSDVTGINARPGARGTPLENRFNGLPSGVIVSVPLGGNKIYAVNNGAKSINSAWQVEGTGTGARMKATVIYGGINPQSHINNNVAIRNRATVTSSGTNNIVQLDTTNQAEWEYLTLQLRP